MKSIDIIAGARPNFIKVAPIIKSIERKKAISSSLFDYRLIHTGQHYDKKMSGDFFNQLGIPAPDINLNVGSGSQAQQTAAIMVSYEEILINDPTDLCLVVGDVNSTAACSIAAKKLNIPVAHVEAGIRSGDITMPEEINRILTDSITDYFFTTSKHANKNLRNMGINDSKIFFVGNTMIDTLADNMVKLRLPRIYEDIRENEYFILTLHRPGNVDNKENLELLLNSIGTYSRGLEIIFPVHPRTMKVIRSIKSIPKNILIADPLPYLEFNYLVKKAKAVITDSGGITEEATYMGIPCLTLRDSTERPETILEGTNELVGSNPKNIEAILEKLFANQWKKGGIPELWDGKTSDRIIEVIEDII
jgi:UDP-N-acetylglucosamine 2-epimerase (non-hydrolysing)